MGDSRKWERIVSISPRVNKTMVRNSILSRRVVFWTLLCTAISVAWAYSTSHANQGEFADFRAIYFSARTALLRHDPYKQSDFLQVYRQEGGTYPTDPQTLRNFWRSVPVCINLPTTLFMVAPLAQAPWSVSYRLWMILMPTGLLIAAWLVLDLGSCRRQGVGLFLICVLLGNCVVVLRLGNATLVAVGLLCISIWCFAREKYVPLAVLCLALSLTIKLQEVGFVWLYFFLVGGVHRKRALQSLGISLVLTLASIAWITSVSPHWLQEFHSNVVATTAKGDLNDPGPTSMGNIGLGMIVSLQSVVSYFSDDPTIYNSVSYLLVGSLILVWVVITLRSEYSQDSAWLALASIAALSMLPVYHRQYDLKLLLLTIPPATMLFAEGHRIGRAAIVVTTLGILLTADIPLAALVVLNKSLHLRQDRLGGEIASVFLARTPTVVLLFEGIFYLWLYARHSLPRKRRVDRKAEEALEMVPASV